MGEGSQEEREAGGMGEMERREMGKGGQGIAPGDCWRQNHIKYKSLLCHFISTSVTRAHHEEEE